ncbi:MAG: type II toxin-antitoxin system PemK/MazF family toxin [Patescibacteria group bacterium]
MDFDIDKMYCGVISRGDVFLFVGDFSAGDGKNEKKTMVVLQDNVLNEGMPTVVGAVIEPYEEGDDVFANEVLLAREESGLGVEGICMTHKVFAVDRRLIMEKRGNLKPFRLQDIYQALDINLGRFRDRHINDSIADILDQ